MTPNVAKILSYINTNFALSEDERLELADAIDPAKPPEPIAPEPAPPAITNDSPTISSTTIDL